MNSPELILDKSNQDSSTCECEANKLMTENALADDTTVISTPSKHVHSCKTAKKSGAFFQRKNGFIKLSESERRSLRREENKVNGRKSSECVSNKISLSELPFHEYFLPKFKVDCLTRYEKFQTMTQMKGGGREDFIFRQMKSYGDIDPQLLCGLIFVEKKFMAKVLFHVLNVSGHWFDSVCGWFRCKDVNSIKFNFFSLK